jgi:hypothetical protein
MRILSPWPEDRSARALRLPLIMTPKSPSHQPQIGAVSRLTGFSRSIDQQQLGIGGDRPSRLRAARGRSEAGL